MLDDYTDQRLVSLLESAPNDLDLASWAVEHCDAKFTQDCLDPTISDRVFEAKRNFLRQAKDDVAYGDVSEVWFNLRGFWNA